MTRGQRDIVLLDEVEDVVDLAAELALDSQPKPESTDAERPWGWNKG